MKNLADTSLNQSNRRISANGFSLLELLITLSIIAILFGMMVPTFKGVRGTAEKLMCANNMRLIYYGLHGYANDNTQLLHSLLIKHILQMQAILNQRQHG